METLLLVDSNALAYRSYFAIRELSTSSGEPTNAVYGFINALKRLLRDLQPGRLACVFDSPGPTFRHGLFADYKIDRPGMPDDLAAQLPLIRELLEAYRVPVVEAPGFEADDLLGAIAREASGKGFLVLLATGDKDLLQLVSDRVKVVSPRDGEIIGPAEVEKKYGFPPGRIPDFLALSGDSSDGIPGVKGIGPKTAFSLLDRFGGLDDIYRRLDEVTPDPVRRKLSEGRDKAFLSRRLADLSRVEGGQDLPIPGLEKMRRLEPDLSKLFPLLERLEFNRLLEEEKKASGKHEGDPEKSGDTLLLVPDESRGGSAGLRNPVEVIFEEIIARPERWRKSLDSPGVIKVGENLKGKVRLLAESGFSGLSPEKSRPESAGLFDDTEKEKDASPPEYPFATLFDLGLASALLGSTAGREGPATEKWRFFSREIAASGMKKLFETVEMPLVPVLAEMERAGLYLDREHLAAVEKKLGRQVAGIEKKVFELVGREFNLNSPSQVSEVLFSDLGLEPVKKTKSGFSTDISVLRSLSDRHPVIPELIRHRHLVRLSGAWLQSLCAAVSPDGRLRTTINQVGASTGRLSSEKPNLQNIPVATPEGIEIRKAFRVQKEGEIFVSFDYSQIELRLMAHFSGDEPMRRAFRQDRDIHAETALVLFHRGREGEEVSGSERRTAKAVNFGLLYGLGAYGLSRQLGIEFEEAKEFIDRYFEQFPGVRAFLDETIENTRRDGYVTTIMGRRRYLPGMNSRRPAEKAAAERMAVNTPIQGSAADIIKAAMVRVAGLLRERDFPARMVLQVHDELLFECPAGQGPALARLVRPAMENVHSLEVPLSVSVKSGVNWAELEPGFGQAGEGGK